MKNIAIIGSGIAGAATAYALKRYGAQVTLFEQGSEIAPEASGNPAALVMPRLDVGDSAIAQLHRDAFIHAVRLYELLGAFTSQGVADTSYDADKIEKLMANPVLPASWLEKRDSGLFHHRGGVVVPRALIQKLLMGVDIKLNTAAPVENLKEYDAIIVCAGRLIADAVQAPFSYRAGQMESMPGNIAHAAMGEGYAVPLQNTIVFGATHEKWADPKVQPGITATAVQQNIDKLKTLAPNAAITTTQSRAAVRAALPDRMPLAGHIRDNIYALGALGARGFTTAPLLADHVASLALDMPSALPSDIQNIIAPARYRA